MPTFPVCAKCADVRKSARSQTNGVRVIAAMGNHSAGSNASQTKLALVRVSRMLRGDDALPVLETKRVVWLSFGTVTCAGVEDVIQKVLLLFECFVAPRGMAVELAVSVWLILVVMTRGGSAELCATSFPKGAGFTY